MEATRLISLCGHKRLSAARVQWGVKERPGNIGEPEA